MCQRRRRRNDDDDDDEVRAKVRMWPPAPAPPRPPQMPPTARMSGSRPCSPDRRMSGCQEEDQEEEEQDVRVTGGCQQEDHDATYRRRRTG